MTRLKFLVASLLLVGVATTSALFYSDSAAALSGRGYFSGRTGNWYSGYGGDVLSGRPGRNAIPASVNTKNEFINFVENKLRGGGKDRLGAAFIVNLLVGAGTGGGNPGKDRTPNAGMMNEFRERVRDDQVTMQSSYGDPNRYGRISFYDPAINDDFFTNYNSGSRALMIFRANGRVVAVIEYPCGNPVGGLPGLPKAREFRNDSTSSSPATAAPGDRITFRHPIKNEGNKNMGRRLNAYVHWDGGVMDGQGRVKNCDVGGNGLGAGRTSNDCNNSYRIPVTARQNQRFCQQVVANPHSSNDNGTISSRTCTQVDIPPGWRLQATSQVTSPASKKGLPSTPYTFRHEVRNNGDRRVSNAGRGFTTVRVEQQHNGGGWSVISSETRRYGSGGIADIAPGQTRAFNVTGTLPSSFARNDQYCQRITVTYGAAYGSRDVTEVETSAKDCVDPEVRFNLIPSTSVNPGDATEPGGSIEVTPVVDNQGPTDSRDNTEWQLVSFVVPRNGAVPGGSTGGGEPCTHYRNQDCAPIGQGEGRFGVGNPSPFTRDSGGQYSLRNFTVPDNARVGDRYCFALSVKPYNQDTSNWRYGTPVCVTIGFRPIVQFWGYDVWSGGGIMGAIKRVNGDTYGSWGEYGVKASAGIENVGSGSGLADGSALSNQKDWSSLTYANSLQPGECSSPYGCHQAYAYPRGFVEQLMALDEDGCAATGNLSNAELQGTGIHCSTGTVRITDNLTYDSNPLVGSTTRWSQRVIIAKDIVIDPDVTRVDAWLIAVPDFDSSGVPVPATGRVSTCSAVNFNNWANAGLTVDDCDERLRVVGPLVSGELYLFRTGGEDDTPAETFELRADAFVGAYNGQVGNRVNAQTTSITELPPRF